MQPDETTASMVAARSFLLGYRSLSFPDSSLKLRAVHVPHSPPVLSSPTKALSRQDMLNSPMMGRQTSQTLPSPSEKAYRARAYPSDHIGNFGRNMRSLLNKVCPENVASVAEKVSAVKIQTAEELHCMIQLLFKKALAEPHYCETYADLVFALKSAFQEFPSPEGGKPVTFRSSLLNTVQAEFEDLQAAGTSAQAPVDRQELEQARKSRALANMKFIGHLFLRHLLPVRVVSSLARALLLCDEVASMPSDVAVECACELLMAVGYTMEASALPIARQALSEACARLAALKREGGYCKRIQFVIQDVLDTRGAGWTRKLFKSSAKTMEEVRLEQQRDLSSQGASSPGVERVVAGQRPTYLAACT
jgi:translation initiation factor 4G